MLVCFKILFLGIFTFPLIIPFSVGMHHGSADDMKTPLLIKEKQIEEITSSNMTYKHIREYDVLLLSVKLVLWENGKAEKQLHICDAEFMGRNFVSFNWKDAQCNWVKPDEPQYRSLQVKYLKGVEYLMELVRYDLWDNKLFPTHLVKDWLRGKGQYLLDHNASPMFIKAEFPNQEEGICFVKPGSKDLVFSSDQNYRQLKNFVELKSVMLVELKNGEEGMELRSCMANIMDKYYFKFDLTKEECNWVKYELNYISKNSVSDVVTARFKQLLSLKMEYKYMDRNANTVMYRYNLWNVKLFPTNLVKEWLDGEGQFQLDHNSYTTQVLFKVSLRKPTKGLCYAWPTIRHVSDDYPEIKEPVELKSVKLVHWEDEAKVRVVDSCTAVIMDKHYFHFADLKDKCNWVNSDEQFLSLQVEYKNMDDNAETFMFRYNLWNTGLFPSDFVKEWLEEKSQFRLDHNNYPKQMLFKLQHKNMSREGFCYVWPTIDNYPEITEHVVLNNVELVQWKDETKIRIVNRCVAEIKDKHYFHFKWEQCIWANHDEQFLTLRVEYKYDEMEHGTSMAHHSAKTVKYNYDIWNTKLFPVAFVKEWLEGKGQFWLEHNGFGRENFFFKTPRLKYPIEGLCYAQPWKNTPVIRHDYPKLSTFERLSSVKLVQWQNAKAERQVGSSCVANIVGEFYFFFKWEECNWAKLDEQFLSLHVEYKIVNHKIINFLGINSKAVSYRYDLWDSELFPADILNEWLRGEGQFRLDHNAFPNEMFYKIPWIKYPIDGLCSASP